MVNQAFGECQVESVTLILQVSKDQESSSAALLLTKAGHVFERVESPHANQPVLFAPEGSFRGLSGIQIYVAMKVPEK